MNTLKSLTSRNLKLFLRDKAMVFFSFLSTLILIGLYFLFIAKLYTNSMNSEDLKDIAISLTDSAKNFMVYLQMMAGVLVLNSISLATGAFSTIAKDFETKKLDTLLLTNVKSYQIVVSYFFAGLIASFTINVFTWVLSFVIIGIATGYWLGIAAFLAVVAILFVASLISCGIMMLVTSLVRSSTAIGVINGILGTFLGFLCGIYMPYSNLGEGTKAVGSFLPFSHLTTWLKQTVLGDAFATLKISGLFKDVLLDDFFSAKSIGFCGMSVPLWVMVLASGLLGFACLAISYILLNRRINSNTKTKIKTKNNTTIK